MSAVVERQPREQTVACIVCKQPTWNLDARCADHLDPPHPRDCYPCKGTGRVIGFGAAHGGPCPADPAAEG